MRKHKVRQKESVSHLYISLKPITLWNRTQERDRSSSGNQDGSCSSLQKSEEENDETLLSLSVTFALWMKSGQQSGEAKSDAESETERETNGSQRGGERKRREREWQTKERKGTIGGQSSCQTFFHQRLLRNLCYASTFHITFNDLCSSKDNAARRLSWKDAHKSELV